MKPFQRPLTTLECCCCCCCIKGKSVGRSHGLSARWSQLYLRGLSPPSEGSSRRVYRRLMVGVGVGSVAGRGHLSSACLFLDHVVLISATSSGWDHAACIYHTVMRRLFVIFSSFGRAQPCSVSEYTVVSLSPLPTCRDRDRQIYMLIYCGFIPPLGGPA